MIELLKHNINKEYPKLFKELKKNINKNIISDINNPNNIYDIDLEEYPDFMKLLNIDNTCNYMDEFTYQCLINRQFGNVTPHTDNMSEFEDKVYILILDYQYGNTYNDSQDIPLLYQDGKFISLFVGSLLSFNQREVHALFYDRRIDYATFWLYKND